MASEELSTIAASRRTALASRRSVTSRAISEKPAISPPRRGSATWSPRREPPAVAAHVHRLAWIERRHQLARLGHPLGARRDDESSMCARAPPRGDSRRSAGGGVPARHRAVEPDGDDRVARGLDDRGQVARRALALAPLRDVADVADELAAPSPSSREIVTSAGNSLPSARSAVSSTGARRSATRRSRPPARARGGARPVRRRDHERRQLLPDHLGAATAEHALGGGVELAHAALGVERDDRVDGRVDDRLLAVADPLEAPGGEHQRAARRPRSARRRAAPALRARRTSRCAGLRASRRRARPAPRRPPARAGAAARRRAPAAEQRREPRVRRQQPRAEGEHRQRGRQRHRRQRRGQPAPQLGHVEEVAHQRRARRSGPRAGPSCRRRGRCAPGTAATRRRA